MEPEYFRSDETSFTDRAYFRPTELIGFADLLLRWPSLSFFSIPFFTVLRKRNDVFGFYMHLFEAKSIGIQKDPANPKQSDAEALRIQFTAHPPYTFRVRYDHLLLNFDMLYFLRSEVEALEKAYPECTIVNDVLTRHNPLYETTRKNIQIVAALALKHLVSSDSTPTEGRNTFREAFINPEHLSWWSGAREGESFPLSYSAKIPKEHLWANLPVPLPRDQKDRKHRKDNDLKVIKPVISVLRDMGIREEKKSAKIIYHLYPHLTAAEIGELYPSKREKERTYNGNRDRGRDLLGLKTPKKPPAKEDKPTA